MENYRTDVQLAQMRALEAAGVCLFCPDELERHAGSPAFLRTAHWTVLPNDFPYAGTSLHLLLVPREHVGDMLDLGDAARADFFTALAAARQRYRIRHYGLGVRNGDCRYTGATIAHLHAHVVVAPPEPETVVRMRFSARPGGNPAEGQHPVQDPGSFISRPVDVGPMVDPQDDHPGHLVVNLIDHPVRPTSGGPEPR
ncbi:MAG: HIT family protein [Streptosporangiaceae bacterium]